MKKTDNESCCAATPDDDKKPAAPVKEYITAKYILYAMPLLIIWWLIYQRLSDFSRVVTYKGILTMVDLGAKSCIPCKMMTPIMEKMEKKYVGNKTSFISG